MAFTETNTTTPRRRPVMRRARAWGFAAAGVMLLIAGAPSRGQQAESLPASAPAAAPASAPASAPVPLEIPAPESVKAYDCPSDDGSAIIVEWAKPKIETPGAVYVVDVAAAKEDFAAGAFKTVQVKPGPEALKSANQKFFGVSPANAGLYYARICPSSLYPPVPAGESRTESLTRHAKAGHLSAEELQRALAASDADAKWLARLMADLTERDTTDAKARTRRINAATYYLRLSVSPDGGRARAYVSDKDGQPLVLSAAALPNQFKWYKLNIAIFSVAFCAVVAAFIWIARRNPNLYIRRIAGLDAVDEGIGRATEMGRPVYFVHGIAGVESMATMASLTILGRVARKAAEYDTRVRVMNWDPMVTAVSQEVVQQAYTEAGRPDAYNPDDVLFISTDNFAYATAVSGLVVRERPAAIFMLGTFFAESLFLAETGASTGAIQISGTDSYSQLPFLITTCDYTLIGEELFAASAYLSREPKMLGSLRGQDVGKAFLMVTIVVITAVLSVAAARGVSLDWLTNLFKTF
ncbi:MAG: hypothetical protein NTV86_13440 [Planctomycetota bacterium]|nr:hypothetical protein [Planctomycetota bacterium]